MLQYCIPLSLIYVDVKYFLLSLQVDSETRQEMHTEPRFNQEAGKKKAFYYYLINDLYMYVKCFMFTCIPTCTYTAFYWIAFSHAGVY